MSFYHDPAIAAKKARNVDVYQETMNICRAGGYDTANGYVDLPPLADVLAASKFYDNPPRVDGKPTVGTTILDAVNADCIDVTRDLVAQGYNPIMLNMANRHTPGGGVLNGARAQEESLFRQSNLCVSLYQYSDYHAGLLGLAKGDGSYPMDRNTGGIYSGRVTFFRTSQRQGDKLVDTPFECAVVSVAAINRPDLNAQGRLVPWAVEATERKIRTMLRIGLVHGHDAIVLGAWGCGAFHNPPEHMAEIFDAVLHEPEFENKFKVVRFAVIEDHNSRHSNYAPFDHQFNGGSVGVSSREMVRAMKKMAKKMHKRDTKPRKFTGAPYIAHPRKVVDLLKSWGYSEDDKDDGIRNIAEHEPPERLVVKIADRLCNTLDFCFSGDVWAKEYLKLGEPLFTRIDECKGANLIKATLAQVRETVANLKDLGFPKELTAAMLKDFKTTERGCTHPRVGMIDGHAFIAKCGSWSDHSSDAHVHNEFVADNLLRAAGFNVPFSREYRVDFGDGLGPQTVRLAVYDVALEPIMQAWGRRDAALCAKIRAQALAAYPVQALIAGIDTFTWDNVKVDADGGLWFVDNGASFDFRACGKKKGWFWDRADVDDPKTGYLSLARHPHQDDLQEILGTVSDNELWQAAAHIRFKDLVRLLPDSHRKHSLKEYAKALQEKAERA